MPSIEIPIETLRHLYEFYYNPATDYRDPPYITEAWREIERLAGFRDRCTCGEEDNTDPEKSLLHKTWCARSQ